MAPRYIPKAIRQEIADKKMQYGIWLGLPEDAKEPKSERELATRFNITQSKLRIWRDDPITQKAKENSIRLWLSAKCKMDVLKSMETKAIDGSVPAARLLLEFWGDVGKAMKEPFNIVANEPIKIEVIKPKAPKSGTITEEDGSAP